MGLGEPCVQEQVQVTLRDGTPAWVLPLRREDKPLLVAGFQDLSEEIIAGWRGLGLDALPDAPPPDNALRYPVTGIVVAALARLNPLAVVLASLVMGGLANAGRAMQGADFPAGMVGTLQGLLLVFVLAGETFARYRVRRTRRPLTTKPTAARARVKTLLIDRGSEAS